MSGRAPTIEVSDLPSYRFGHHSLTWWSTAGLMVIEGTAFVIAALMYFYLRGTAPAWPFGALPPAWTWGTLNTAIMILSLLPNHLAKVSAERGNRERARLWLGVCIVCALAFLVVRGLEFASLNVKWYDSAYGSIVWLLLGLHTTHLITDTLDTAVLLAVLFTGPFENLRLVDVSENAMYWNFVVASWLPLYAVIYLAPHF